MLNPRSIESALKSATREVVLTDGTGERGTGRLALRIRPGRDGARAEWIAVWWSDGRRRQGLVGRYPALSLRQARDEFTAAWRPEIEAGRDPRRAVRLAAAAGTVRQLFAEYIGSMKARGLRSWPQVDRSLVTGRYSAERALGAETLAADVTSAMVADFLARAYRRGSRVSADRTRAHLHAAFQWGAQSAHDYTRDGGDWPVTQFWLTANPVSVVPRDVGATKPRSRALDQGELVDLWHAADPEAKGFGLLTAPAVRLLICTGQRVTDVLRAEGADFDLERALWTIPASKRKVGEHEHIVPMSPRAEAIVAELIRIRGKGPLFPCATRPDEPAPDQTVNRALARWIERTGGCRFQARDLRRTWKTLAGEAGLSKEIRDRLQGHALTDVSSVHYDRYQYLREKRAAVSQWAAWLDSALGAGNPE